MGKFIDWEHTPNTQSRGSDYLVLRNGTFTVRFLTRPLVYYQRWSPIACRVEPGNDPFAETSDEGPKKRSAVFVLDRADNCVKIMDIGATVAKAITSWAQATGRDPAGQDAPDFCIKVTGQGLQTRYMVAPLSHMPLDGIDVPPREELETRLAEARRANTPEEIEAKMDKARSKVA